MSMCCELRCSDACSQITTFRCEDCAPRGACSPCFHERHRKGSTHKASWYCQDSHVWKPWVNTSLFPQPWGCNCTDGLTHELDVISFTCTTRAKIWYCQHTPLLAALRLNQLWPLTATAPQVAFEDSVLMLLKNVRFDRAQFPLPNYAYLKALGCADRFNVSEFTESFLSFCFLQKEMRQCQFISADEIQRRVASQSSSASISEIPVQQQEPHLAEPAISTAAAAETASVHAESDQHEEPNISFRPIVCPVCQEQALHGKINGLAVDAIRLKRASGHSKSMADDDAPLNSEPWMYCVKTCRY